nr:unnamed protein product [Digitaria exilis]
MTCSSSRMCEPAARPPVTDPLAVGSEVRVVATGEVRRALRRAGKKVAGWRPAPTVVVGESGVD